jgi:hypothetical protein
MKDHVRHDLELDQARLGILGEEHLSMSNTSSEHTLAAQATRAGHRGSRRRDDSQSKLLRHLRGDVRTLSATVAEGEHLALPGTNSSSRARGRPRGRAHH